MVNESKVNDPRFWKRWQKAGAIGDVYGQSRGEAYAFFNCNASPEQIAEEIPKIRELVRAPKRLELYLAPLPVMPVFSGHSVDSELLEIGMDAKEAGIRYVLAARGTPNMSNRDTADELAGIINQAYQSPLYQDGEEFRGEIAYKQGERYTFRD